MQKLLVSLVTLALAFVAPASAQKTQIKFATLVPEGTVWDQQVRLFGEEVTKRTGGKVAFRYYSGGVAGDEPDIIRKMRIGQLNGAFLTLSGLVDVDRVMQAFQIPMYFRDDAEVIAALREVEGTIRERMEAAGFVVLGWGTAGWLRFFSTAPVRTMRDLKGLKQFVWAGDNKLVGWYRDRGFQPVPLAATDMLTGLKTGLIESLPATPLAALSLQWFRSAGNMLDYPIAPLLTATVVSKRTWDKLEPAEREALLLAGKRCEDYLMNEVARQEEQAIAEMKERGLMVTEPATPPDNPEWRDVATYFAARMSENQIPPEILARIERRVQAVRGGASGGGGRERAH